MDRNADVPEADDVKTKGGLRRPPQERQQEVCVRRRVRVLRRSLRARGVRARRRRASFC
jgi:hypothetical protein